MSKGKIIGGGSVAAAIAMTLIFIFPYEGEKLKSYQDVGGVWTICRGHTATAKPNMTVTKEQCKLIYESDVGKAFDQTWAVIDTGVTVNELVAYTDFVFNAGIGNFKKSTMLRKLNAGDHVGACDALLKWKYAGGKDCSNPLNKCLGLWKRRKDERLLCLQQ